MLKLIVYYLPMPFVVYLLYLLSGSCLAGGLFFLGSFPFLIRMTEIKSENLRKKLKIFVSNYLFLYKTLCFMTLSAIGLGILGWGTIIKTPAFIWLSLVFYILSMWRGYQNYIQIKIKEYTVEISDYDTELNLVFLSDIHLSELRSINYVKEIVEKVNGLSADCILVGGDTIESHMEYLEDKGFDQTLKKMRSEYGVYGVLGNHEYTGDLNKNMEYLDRCGIKILRDESIIIKKLEFIFRDDKTNDSRKKLKDIYKSVYPKIVVDHRPKFEEALSEGAVLQISGHTHGGQFFPVNLGYMLKYKVIYGYKKIKNTAVIVSSGAGTGFFTYRTWSKSEIVRITIRGKAHE
ncbi:MULTISPECIES: metallophosphoesterase [Psychrilyobacter]|uniref:Metallophosphoesterase n=1 Tax=Psychrilyobacter piezotolerans TaxID=2293438 RepID=A0ABX9KG88_9FUSO|nr:MULTISPECIES: metallophosphoesterase [Psychrilyobacter]MCS5420439.1 metallophosphoesterase [Psychrilyobacter sp. S5]NDI78218.1 metallophosphoesterase [Psychrilyobacter piezotolerans]RDE61219.1 metallophosphoesterase [Psychrilyobacter sp. S5]REI40887.1 metallophosphoesterase [Psychrilyobacter piezotolerans]